MKKTANVIKQFVVDFTSETYKPLMEHGDGKVIQRRYYGPDGKAEFDVDYTNHGNPNAHPTVPHGHEWRWDLNPKNPPRPEVKLPW